MSFEKPRSPLQEEPKEPELHERLDELEKHVHRLIEETSGHLANIPSGQELAATAEGQSKLVKIQEAAMRFNQRVVGVVALINVPTIVALFAQRAGELGGADWAGALESVVNSGGRITSTSLVVACALIAHRTMKMHEQANKAIDAIQHRM